MDEPDQYLDWHALQFYSRLFHDGIASERKSARLVFRGDNDNPRSGIPAAVAYLPFATE
jgi:hypothetical protein